MSENGLKKCPHCGHELQENASFCLYCMERLTEKEVIEKKKRTLPGRGMIAVVGAVLALAIAAVFIVPRLMPSASICTFEDFSPRAVAASERLGCDELWSPESLVDFRVSPDGKSTVYTADTSFDGALMYMYFENGGETVSFSLCSLTESELEDAKRLAVCIIDGVCNNYLKETEDFIKNDSLYPMSDYDEPFEKYFTDYAHLTEQYEKDMNGGVKIDTDYKSALTETGVYMIDFLVTRYYGDNTLYDLCLYFESADARGLG